jgi:hypothetical protein
MRTLDQEESTARVAHTDGPTPEEPIESLRELPELWDDADPSGRRLLAEALFDRIDILSVHQRIGLLYVTGRSDEARSVESRDG